MTNAYRDENSVPTIITASSSDGFSIVRNEAIGGSTTVDSFTESNFQYPLSTMGSLAFSELKLGMSFINVNEGTLENCYFLLSRFGSPTGNITATLYAVTGTSGTDATPTGVALATSDPVDVSTIQSSLNGDTLSDYTLQLFTFTGVNRYSLSANTTYAIAIEYSGGDASNFLFVGGGGSNLPAGNPVVFDYPAGPWSSFTGDAYIFYVNSTVSHRLKVNDNTTGSDAGNNSGNAMRDENSVPVWVAVSSADGVTPVEVYSDPLTQRLLINSQ